MADARTLINGLIGRYIPGKVSTSLRYYFNVDGDRYTLVCHPDRVEIIPGPSEGKADVVIKCTAKMFEKVFVDRGMPGPLDIARGRFKTNDVEGLRRLAALFR